MAVKKLRQNKNKEKLSINIADVQKQQPKLKAKKLTVRDIRTK